MAHIAVSVEGITEAQFVANVLRPHLAGLGLTIKPISKGGSISLSSIRPDLRELLKDHGNACVTTFYDYYGFRGQHTKPVEEIEADMHALVGNEPRLIPYLQLHEFEALVFSGPTETADILRDPAMAAGMIRIVQQCGSPETINDEEETTPSKRLKRLNPSYDKARHGYQIIERIGLDKVRAACPRFASWLSRLELFGTRP
jgi:hypothetical protein